MQIAIKHLEEVFRDFWKSCGLFRIVLRGLPQGPSGTNVVILILVHSYNMFGHFKFCITLVGGYLLFHDPLSLNQVSLPVLL